MNIFILILSFIMLIFASIAFAYQEIVTLWFIFCINSGISVGYILSNIVKEHTHE